MEFQIIWEMAKSWQVSINYKNYNEDAKKLSTISLEHPHIYTKEDIPYLLLQWVIISSLAYFLILLLYYIFYRFKKKQNPLKYAFKKSRLWWITILLIPVVIFVVCIIIDSVNGF